MTIHPKDSDFANDRPQGGHWLHRFVRRFVGIPVWTEDHDGECRKRWAKPQPNGTLKIRAISDYVVANLDGTIRTDHYVVKWWPRPSIFSANDKMRDGESRLTTPNTQP